MTTFRIKRSPTSGNPALLAQGELAYSYLANNGSNGGDTLYIGTGTETTGNAANHVKIGGLYYTTAIDNATASNTVSTIVKRDSSGNFVAGTITASLTGNASTATKWFTARNLSLTGDATATLSSVDGSADVSAALTLASVNSNAVTLATTAASGNGTTATITYATQASNPFTIGQSITVTGVTPNGYNGTYTVTAVSTTQVQYANTTTGSQTVAGTVVANFGSSTFIPVITVNAKGLITAISNTAISTTINLAGSTGSGSVAGGGTLTVTGGAGISTSVSGSTITISSTGAGGYTTTATSGTTYTLTSTSTPAQYFTGSTAQVVKLPDATSLTLGQEYILTNNSSANLTVNTSTSASVLTQIPGTTVSYTVVSTGGNTAASWNYEYTGFAGITGTGNVVLATAPTISGHPTIEGVTSTGATGTGNFVFATSPTISAPTISGHPTIEGVTSTGATGTGNLVFSAGATLTGTTKLGDISIATDTISNTTSSTNIIIAPTGKVQFGSGTPGSGAAYQFPAVDSTSSGYVLTSQANGTLIWAAASSTLSLAGTTGTGSVSLTTGTLTFAGGTSVSAAVTGTGGSNTVTVSVSDATTTTKGIASFSSTYFSVSSGAVSPSSVTGTGAFVLASAPTITGHPTIEGVTSTGATGTGNFVFSASPTLTGTTSIATLNLTNALGVAYGGTGTTNGSITGTGALTFTSGGTNTNINLVPNGTGTVDVGSKRITSLADPTAATDAVTKQYVDAATQGLNVHDSVDIFADSTNTAITGATYSNGTSDTSGGTGIGATLTDATTGTVLSIDGYTVQQYDRVLVNAFTSTSAKYNGIYTLTTVGVNGTTKWVLTRATDFNNSTSGQVRPGDFTFIYRGTTYNKTGWVQTTVGTGTPFETIKLGIDSVTWTQFAGAGTYTAGNGLTLTGSAFSIDTSITVDKTTSQTLTNKTLSTGVVYNGGVIGSTYGGTGVNNGSSTITIGGNVTLSGAYTFAGTLTANTSVTFPTTGTLVNTAVTSLSSLSTVGTITSGTWNASVIGASYGGTGFSTYSTGDLIYASATNTLSKLPAATNGQILQLVGGAPAWGDLDGGTY